MKGPIKQFPHCDSRILHKPGECAYCDKHPDWQQLREVWGINFTGGRKKKDGDNIWLPCPAEVNRPLAIINEWGGNVPAKKCDEKKK